MKAVVAAFNQEKALVGAFSVITNLWMELFQALRSTHSNLPHYNRPDLVFMALVVVVLKWKSAVTTFMFNFSLKL